MRVEGYRSWHPELERFNLGERSVVHAHARVVNYNMNSLRGDTRSCTFSVLYHVSTHLKQNEGWVTKFRSSPGSGWCQLSPANGHERTSLPHSGAVLSPPPIIRTISKYRASAKYVRCVIIIAFKHVYALPRVYASLNRTRKKKKKRHAGRPANGPTARLDGTGNGHAASANEPKPDQSDGTNVAGATAERHGTPGGNEPRGWRSA